MMRRLRLVLTGIGLISSALFANRPASAALVLDDPLNGATSGTRQGGVFVSDGWKITGKQDYIYWHLPSSVSCGAVEFYVKGLIPRDPPETGHSDNNLFEMYDYTFENADKNYMGFRNNPYKMRLNKNGPDYDYNGTTDVCQVVWIFPPDDPELEWDTPVLVWDPQINYKFRLEWGPPSGGYSLCKILRNDVVIWQRNLAGAYTPNGHSVRLAWSTRDVDVAPLNAVFSNVKVYDLQSSVPAAPTIVKPTSGQTVNTNIAFIAWTGDPQTQFQVQVNTANQPDTGIAWDSGLVTSGQRFTWTGSLLNNVTYYVFVRLANGGAFGPWSASGRSFTVNTSYVPPGADVVQLWGNSVVQKSGPFLGLGASYMQALRRCKYDRTRFQSDLAFLASKEFKYVRVLTMVGWYEAWAGKEIAPISFTTRDGRPIAAWPDYWQQFRDMIDIAYDSYGIRTELTIFADAQLIPKKADRINHMQTILNNLVGREHKIMHLEVCNEAWQNGFPGIQGIADLREFAQYLADRTSIPVAITSPEDTTDAGITTLYGGSAADIATVHFDRDISTAEGGWRPVRDCWRTGLFGVPPMSSNEPIGPGSSVNSENDPIKLVMAAVFAWGANLPLYVFHCEAGVFGNTTFENTPGISGYIHLNEILPPDFSSWVRNDGREASAAFTSYCNGQANKWWPEVGGAASGVVRNTGKIKGGEFLTFPIGILAGGVELEARRPMSFQVYKPLSGAVAYALTKNAGEHFSLAQGPGAYIIKGIFTDVMNPSSDVTIDLGSPDVSNGLTHPQSADGNTTPATIGGRTCRQNTNPGAGQHYFYFSVNDTFAFQGNKPDLYIILEYFDTGTSTITLEYDSSTGPEPDAYYRVGGSATLTNTNTWKFKTFHVTDAYFGNRQNDGADFRFGDIGNVFYLDKVRVTTEPPLAPVIAEAVPDPEIIRPNTAYVRQLSLLLGNPAPNWTVVQGPAGIQVGTAGLVSGWTPGPTSFGSFVFEIGASNSEGSDTESWVVQVVSQCDLDLDGDVDQTDFGYVQQCVFGEGHGYSDGCGAADFQHDGDVDAQDLGVFQSCMNGAGQLPGC